jgi:hypothetical protein
MAFPLCAFFGPDARTVMPSLNGNATLLPPQRQAFGRVAFARRNIALHCSTRLC